MNEIIIKEVGLSFEYECIGLPEKKFPNMLSSIEYVINVSKRKKRWLCIFKGRADN